MFVPGGVARLFQRSAACVTVGALGPNAQHFLHATNFGSTSLLIQTSEPPQKGQGCNGSTETGNPGIGLIVRCRRACARGSPALGAIKGCEAYPACRPHSAGIYLVEETLDFALISTRMFFEAAEQMLLLRQ